MYAHPSALHIHFLTGMHLQYSIYLCLPCLGGKAGNACDMFHIDVSPFARGKVGREALEVRQPPATQNDVPVLAEGGITELMAPP